MRKALEEKVINEEDIVKVIRREPDFSVLIANALEAGYISDISLLTNDDLSVFKQRMLRDLAYWNFYFNGVLTENKLLLNSPYLNPNRVYLRSFKPPVDIYENLFGCSWQDTFVTLVKKLPQVYIQFKAEYTAGELKPALWRLMPRENAPEQVAEVKSPPAEDNLNEQFMRLSRSLNISPERVRREFFAAGEALEVSADNINGKYVFLVDAALRKISGLLPAFKPDVHAILKADRNDGYKQMHYDFIGNMLGDLTVAKFAYRLFMRTTEGSLSGEMPGSAKDTIYPAEENDDTDNGGKVVLWEKRYREWQETAYEDYSAVNKILKNGNSGSGVFMGHAFLTREQEVLLAEEIKKGNKAALAILVSISGEKNLFNKLLKLNPKMNHETAEEIVDHHRVKSGLMSAALEYNPVLYNTRYFTFAWKWVRNSIPGLISKYSSSVGLPYNFLADSFKINEAIEIISEEEGIIPDAKRIAEYINAHYPNLNFSEFKVKSVIQARQNSFSLDQPVHSDSDTLNGEKFSAGGASEPNYQEIDIKNMLKIALEKMDKKAIAPQKQLIFILLNVFRYDFSEVDAVFRGLTSGNYAENKSRELIQGFLDNACDLFGTTDNPLVSLINRLLNFDRKYKERTKQAYDDLADSINDNIRWDNTLKIFEIHIPPRKTGKGAAFGIIARELAKTKNIVTTRKISDMTGISAEVCWGYFRKLIELGVIEQLESAGKEYLITWNDKLPREGEVFDKLLEILEAYKYEKDFAGIKLKVKLFMAESGLRLNKVDIEGHRGQDLVDAGV